MGGRGFEAPKAPNPDAEGVEGVGNAEEVPLPSRLGGLGSVVSSPNGVRGGAPAKKTDFSALQASQNACR